MNRDDVNDEGGEEAGLSDQGLARRRAILSEAFRAADRRRHKRLAARAGTAAAAAVACAVAIASIVMSRSPRPDDARPIVQEVPPNGTSAQPPAPPNDYVVARPIVVIRPRPPAATQPAVRVEVVRDDPSKRRWEVVNDDQLLAALADAGRPSGLARVNGESMLVPLN